MGDPRKSKKTFHRPRRIWTSDQLNAELYIIGSYGLRNKRELWKAQSDVARFRNQSRALLALPSEVRSEKETQLLGFLNRLGLVSESATLDDVLNLTTQIKLLSIAGAVLNGEQLLQIRRLALNISQIFRWFDSEKRVLYPALALVINETYYEKIIIMLSHGGCCTVYFFILCRQ